MRFIHVFTLICRKLPYCTHLCPEICHPGQCPAPEKCSEKVTVRCGCQTLKKEWLCHDVQAAYRSARSDLKDISKNQYGLGLLPCNSGCRSKVKVADTELQHRKSTVLKVILISSSETCLIIYFGSIR
ncbi:hypothetical protein CsSME_00028685 [Camellia sinensis var. sinensis]